MAKQTKQKPKPQPLPGMENRAIQPLEEIARAYVDLRDRRMELTQKEAALKGRAIALMRKLEKTVYRRDGVEIVVMPGEEKLKVKVASGDKAAP